MLRDCQYWALLSEQAIERKTALALNISLAGDISVVGSRPFLKRASQPVQIRRRQLAKRIPVAIFVPVDGPTLVPTWRHDDDTVAGLQVDLKPDGSQIWWQRVAPLNTAVVEVASTAGCDVEWCAPEQVLRFRGLARQIYVSDEEPRRSRQYRNVCIRKLPCEPVDCFS